LLQTKKTTPSEKNRLSKVWSSSQEITRSHKKKNSSST